MDRLSPRSPKKSPIREGEYHKHTILQNREHDVNEMDRVMLDYLDIEGLLKLYKRSPELFTQYHLNRIADRFELSHVESFKELLYNYDTKYATLRSLYRKDANIEYVVKKAARQGNIQVVTIGLKTHPELQTERFYNSLLKGVGESGNRDLILLLEDLGATRRNKVFLGASEGGHLGLVKEYTSLSGKRGRVDRISEALRNAALNSHLEVLKYLVGLIDEVDYVDGTMFSAGQSGNQEIIDYLISKGATNYDSLVNGAAYAGHLATIKKYYTKPGVSRQGIFSYAIKKGHLNVAKYAAKKGPIDLEVLNESMEEVGAYDLETIEYLLELGADNYNRVVQLAVTSDNIELLKRYYDRPGVELEEAFEYALENLASLKFLIEVAEYVPTERLLKNVTREDIDPEIKEYLLSIEALRSSGSSTESDTESEESD